MLILLQKSKRPSPSSDNYGPSGEQTIGIKEEICQETSKPTTAKCNNWFPVMPAMMYNHPIAVYPSSHHPYTPYPFIPLPGDLQKIMAGQIKGGLGEDIDSRGPGLANITGDLTRRNTSIAALRMRAREHVATSAEVKLGGVPQNTDFSNVRNA